MDLVLQGNIVEVILFAVLDVMPVVSGNVQLRPIKFLFVHKTVSFR